MNSLGYLWQYNGVKRIVMMREHRTMLTVIFKKNYRILHAVEEEAAYNRTIVENKGKEFCSKNKTVRR